MAAPRLKVNGFDFSTFLRHPARRVSLRWEAAGMDYFSLRSSLARGATRARDSMWVGDSVSNRTMVFPASIFTGWDPSGNPQVDPRTPDEALVRGAPGLSSTLTPT